MRRSLSLGISAILLILQACAAGDAADNPSGAPAIDTRPEWLRVCSDWNGLKASIVRDTWTGDVASCRAGNISPAEHDSALRTLNLFRRWAGLDTVIADPELDGAAQQCALMMEANNTIDHYPSEDWACYNPHGATAAGRSNLTMGRGVAGSIPGFFVDGGANNFDALGHRQWFLMPNLGPVGIGGTTRMGCVWVVGGEGTGTKDWIAWPPGGGVPFDVVAPLSNTGWSIQSGVYDLDAADVNVRVDGEPVAIHRRALSRVNPYMSAVGFMPNGWTVAPWTTITVEVTAANGDGFSYDVDVLGCDAGEAVCGLNRVAGEACTGTLGDLLCAPGEDDEPNRCTVARVCGRNAMQDDICERAGEGWRCAASHAGEPLRCSEVLPPCEEGDSGDHCITPVVVVPCDPAGPRQMACHGQSLLLCNNGVTEERDCGFERLSCTVNGDGSYAFCAARPPACSEARCAGDVPVSCVDGLETAAPECESPAVCAATDMDAVCEG